MKITALKHIIEQPFVTATGIAALVHSTWSLGTLFSGAQPSADLSWQFVGWLAPALLIAFALDIGQIATSADIRQHGLNFGRGITFVVFAAATYYLQWLYMAHHMPLLDIAPGVSATAAETAISLRDAAIWLIPALLPLSTLLYTLSGGQEQPRAVEQQRVNQLEVTVEEQPIRVEQPRVEQLEPPLDVYEDGDTESIPLSLNGRIPRLELHED